MPVYNGERYLRQAIDSVISQEYPSWELVIADDGSTDHTQNIIREYNDPRIRYFFQENHGQASALNLALSHSLGEFITTLDADDWLPVDSIGKRVSHLAAHPEHGAVYGDGYYCSENGAVLARFSDYCLSNLSGDIYKYLVISNMFGTGAAVLIRKSDILNHHLSYDERINWCQDWDFYVRLAEITTFGFTPLITVNYRIHHANMTMQMPSLKRSQSKHLARQKILAGQKFSTLPLPSREQFFTVYLRENLRDQNALQKENLEGIQFKNLPPYIKGKICRLIAGDYLLTGHSYTEAKEWISFSRGFNPHDKKTLILDILIKVHPKIAAYIYAVNQRRNRGKSKTNPYDLIQ
jgi:glycosyltransferase involved in cell wall biosynthesis